jgi:hypothetical protein
MILSKNVLFIIQKILILYFVFITWIQKEKDAYLNIFDTLTDLETGFTIHFIFN